MRRPAGVCGSGIGAGGRAIATDDEDDSGNQDETGPAYRHVLMPIRLAG